MFAVRRSFAVTPLFLIAAAALPARGDDMRPAEVQPKEARAAARPLPAPNPAPPQAPPVAPSAPRLSITGADGKAMTCREQSAQSFLVRGNWFPKTSEGDKLKEGRKLLEDAIKYRTEKYGYFEGFGSAKLNAHPPKFYAKPTSFMGMSVQVHERIIPALKCVEAALKAGPASGEYHPRAMGGIRFKNTYRGVEISNHVYGIAIDIEPDKNTCCGCVKPWNEHPLCKDKEKSVWQRMAMPRSWVDTFEKYGFYWLGHDELQDTMHFEFLGDPDKILDQQGAIATKN